EPGPRLQERLRHRRLGDGVGRLREPLADLHGADRPRRRPRRHVAEARRALGGRQMIDRRELIERAAAMLGTAVSASAMAGVLAGCASTPGAAPGPKRFFSTEEMQIAAAMADQIIPRTDTPGALDAGVAAYMDRMMVGYYTDKERDILRAGLRQ